MTVGQTWYQTQSGYNQIEKATAVLYFKHTTGQNKTGHTARTVWIIPRWHCKAVDNNYALEDRSQITAALDSEECGWCQLYHKHLVRHKSKAVKRLCEIIGCRQTTTLAHHPTGNSAIERLWQWVEQCIKLMTADRAISRMGELYSTHGTCVEYHLSFGTQVHTIWGCSWVTSKKCNRLGLWHLWFRDTASQTNVTKGSLGHENDCRSLCTAG